MTKTKCITFLLDMALIQLNYHSSMATSAVSSHPPQTL